MADNVTTPIGSGVAIATDDVGGTHYQIIKLAFGALDTATLVDGTNPLPITVSNFPSTQAISAAALPLPAGAAISAKQAAPGSAGTASTDVLTVQGIAGAVAIPTSPSMTSGGNISVATASPGTNYAAFASQACKQLTIVNNTGFAIEFRQGAAGVAIPIVDKSAFTVFGITNANQIDVRRIDNAGVVTVHARWES